MQSLGKLIGYGFRLETEIVLADCVPMRLGRQIGSSCLRRFFRFLAGAILGLLLCDSATRLFALEPQDFAVQSSAEVFSNPAQIRLEWLPSSFATGYTVSRKLLNDQ